MPDLTPEEWQRLVDGALAGDPEALDELVAKARPILHQSVAAMLRLWHVGSAAGRHLRQEVEDLVQEVLLYLYKDDWELLRRWDREIGAFEAWLHYLAGIRTAQELRSPRSHLRQEPVAPEDLPITASRAPSAERESFSKDLLEKILLCLYAHFSPRDFHRFDLLFVKEVPAREAGEETAATVDAIYKWRSRQYKKARACLRKIQGEKEEEE